MGQQQVFKMSVTLRLLLAAMTLMLPLIVFVFILVDERDTEIHATEYEISGVEYLMDLRQLLELVPHHSALHQIANLGDPTADKDITKTVARIDQTILRLVARAESTDDPFVVLPLLQSLHTSWLQVDHNDHVAALDDVLKTDNSIQHELVRLFRHIGNTANLALDGSLETNHLTDLIVHQLPQMIARLSIARSRAVGIVDRGVEPTLIDRNHQSVDDWALALMHDNLFYGFNVAVQEDPQIAENLSQHFATFDRDTHNFHALVASGNIRGTPESILQLGTSSIDATLKLFDEIVPELLRILENRMSTLQNTRLIAIGSVLLASVIAAISGWLLLRSMTRPLQAEILERRRAETRLGELADIVEQSEDAILTLSFKGKFRSWNAGAQDLYGYAAEEVLGKKVSILAPDGYENETKSLLRRAIAGEHLPAHETVRVRKDGNLVDVSMRFSVVRDAEGAPRGVAVIARDITDRKKSELELIRKEQQLQSRVTQLNQAQTELKQHHDRLEELVRDRTTEVQEKAAELEVALQKEKGLSALQRQFVSMASHEFRTPLAIIDGAVQRIERRIDRIEKVDLELRLSRIRGAVTRMLGLIESSLSASRLDAGRVHMNTQALDIRGLVAEVCERHAELSEQPVLNLQLDGLPSEIDGDPALLDQVLTNLISNAIKYSPDDPVISVSGQGETEGRISIAITDNGVGIPAEELSNLFDRFFRASTSEGIPGTGIGLNLAHELVAMHSGAISVQSEINVGTTFTVHLPTRQMRDNRQPQPLTTDAAA